MTLSTLLFANTDLKKPIIAVLFGLLGWVSLSTALAAICVNSWMAASTMGAFPVRTHDASSIVYAMADGTRAASAGSQKRKTMGGEIAVELSDDSTKPHLGIETEEKLQHITRQG